MNSIFSIAASALRAFGRKLESTAHNVANMNTEDYRPVEVRMEEGRNGGVSASVSRPEEAYSVDLSKEITDMMVTEHAIKANLRVIRTEDGIVRNTLDIKA